MGTSIGKIVVLGMLAVAVVCGFPQTGHASVPGRNGDIAWVLGDRVWRNAHDALTPRAFIASDESVREIAYSPDGRRIAVIGRRRGQMLEVWMMRSDGSKLHQVTDSPRGKAVSVGFSPDGRRLVVSYVPRRGQDADIYVVRTDGTRMRRLTTSATHDRAPQWSPNGRYILYNRVDRDGGAVELWSIRPDGTRNRLFERLRSGAFDLMPGGRGLLFMRDSEVWRLDFRSRRRTFVARASSSPTTSQTFFAPVVAAPNGKGFAVHYSLGDGCYNYIDTFRFGGGPARRIICTGDIVSSFAWQPRPGARS